MSALAQITRLCLARARHSPNFLEELARLSEVVAEVLAAPNGVAALASVLSYILEVTEVQPEELHDYLVQLGPKAVEAYMTGAQQLTEQVRKDALNEGRAEVLLRQLKIRFGSVTSETEARVRQASVAELDTWAERILTADSIDGVFGD